MIKAQRGTKDVFGEQILLFNKIQSIGREIFTNANFGEIQTPIFEATELFARGVGDSTDIVNKEMYSFKVGESENSLTLRPENTAGVVRAYIEHNMARQSPPQKLWYFAPMFRYERPQAGRQRQFHQIGAEVFGTEAPSADAEAILLATELLSQLGLSSLVVELNSLGCPTCRDGYKTSIKNAVKPHLENLCPDCIMRYEKNPLRMLDCKNDNCKNIFELPEIKQAVLADFICEPCEEHFRELKNLLDILNINYATNRLLVRGLDYYNRTVFEIKSNNLGSQNAVCGGGRYDGLVEMLGGPKTPAVGWAMGVERLCSLLGEIEVDKLDYYVVSKFQPQALKLAKTLRNKGFKVDFDMQNRKFVKQLEKASKISKNAIILGEDEIAGNFLTVKNLETGEQIQVTEI